MCLLERYTARRGRCAVPTTFLRTRRWRRTRSSVFDLIRLCLSALWSRSCSGLPGLALDHFVGVADSLALVRLGLPQLADVGGHLPHELLVDAHHADLGGLGHLEGHALGRFEAHRVRVAEGQLQ